MRNVDPGDLTVRVLIVSEDAAVRRRASTAFHRAAVSEWIEATTAGEAHRLVLEAPFDVVVIDGDLAPEGGFSVLYELRAADELRGTRTPPSIVMAGREQDRWLGEWAGANVVLVKPVDPFELARHVRDLAEALGAPSDAIDEAGAEVAAALDGDLAPGGAPTAG